MITVAGEALIDLVGNGDGRYRAFPGGGPCNTAVALARLGVPVSLLARLGRDRFGQQLRAHLRTNGVRTRHLVRASEATTLAVVDVDDQGRAEYGFYVAGTADWQWSPEELPELSDEVEALCVGTLAMAMSPGARVLEEFARTQHAHRAVTVLYDPNPRPGLGFPRSDERQRVERQATLADVVKLSDEDLGWLYPGEDPSDRAGRLLELGPSLVVVTRGAAGAYACTRQQSIGRPAPRMSVVDSVGAGDAFSAGLLVALRRHGMLGGDTAAAAGSLGRDELAGLLDHAVAVASLSCTRAGADSPTTDELPPVPSDGVVGPAEITTEPSPRAGSSG